MTEPSWWESVKECLPWVPGLYAVFRVERNASASHDLLFDEHGQTRVVTTETCDKCRNICREDDKTRGENLRTELQNIHAALRDMQNTLIELSGRAR